MYEEFAIAAPAAKPIMANICGLDMTAAICSTIAVNAFA